MKLQVLQEELSKALNTCSRFASSRIQLPVLANILFKAQKNKLLAYATNLETSISISLGAKVEEPGEITIPSKLITELISHLGPGQLSLETDKETLIIKSSGFNSTIPGMNSADFPHVPDEIGLDSIKLPPEKFTEGLSSVLFATSTDEIRPVLTGVLMIMRENNLVLVATDGFRLSQKKIKVDKLDEEKKVIIPKNVLSELSRLATSGEAINFSYKKSENQVVFAVQNYVLSSRVIEGEFPDFEKIIPRKTNIKVNPDREDLLRAVKLSSVFARDAANVIKVKITKGEIEVSAESHQSGMEKTKVEAKIEAEGSAELLIAFNYRFLEDFLGVVKSNDVQMEFSDPNAPALFLDPKDTEFLHIIMPVRLQS